MAAENTTLKKVEVIGAEEDTTTGVREANNSPLVERTILIGRTLITTNELSSMYIRLVDLKEFDQKINKGTELRSFELVVAVKFTGGVK